MNVTADKLREARALIERGWTQRRYARGKSGREVSATGNSATCFCALGALRHAYRNDTDFTPAAPVLRKAIGGRDIIDWNDAEKRTQADVLAAFDKAIELAEQSL